MGATVHFELSSSVTHLVVGEVQSNKYIVASEEGIPTVTKDWVNYLWDISVNQLQPITPQSSNYEQLTSSFKSGIFHGCTISCSNVESDEKEQLAKMISSNGGTYATSMDKKKCTHLAMGGLGGEKFKYAKEWGLTIVKTNWIIDSVNKGFAQLVSRKKYQVAETIIEEESEVKNSQPECSSISDELFSLMQQSDCLDTFDQMCFFISGFADDLSRKMETLIRDNGGFVFDKYCASVTHVIMNKDDLENNPDLRMNNQMNLNCEVVYFE